MCQQKHENKAGNVPALYWLSGLTCNDENFLIKAGAQKRAAELGIALVMPDTSPRGTNIEGEHTHYDFGSGAGFYVNATAKPWSENYNMFAYVNEELPQIVQENFSQICRSRRSISGHSMGGHGALISALKTVFSFKNEIYHKILHSYSCFHCYGLEWILPVCISIFTNSKSHQVRVGHQGKFVCM